MTNIKQIINAWDPIDLLYHAPEDEYHSEIEDIDAALKQTTDVVTLSDFIYNIFTKSFGCNFQKTKQECLEIANKIIGSVDKIK